VLGRRATALPLAFVRTQVLIMANWLYADGKLKAGSGNRPPRLEEPEWELDGVQYHHLIPYNTLRAFWNGLVDKVKPQDDKYVRTGHHKFQMEQYIKLIDYEEQARAVTTAIWKGKLNELQPDVADTLAIKLCWQKYNIMIGPSSTARPVHAPDPNELFEGPPVHKCHLIRFGQLREANESMIEYAGSRSVLPLSAALSRLEKVYEEPIIPIHDVNWNAINHTRFNSLTETQRLQFHLALQEPGRAAEAEQVFADLFVDNVF
jgi:hypothetical protein